MKTVNIVARVVFEKQEPKLKMRLSVETLPLYRLLMTADRKMMLQVFKTFSFLLLIADFQPLSFSCMSHVIAV